MATVSLGIVIDTANNSIIASDTSDYAGQGISTADVVGNIEVLVDGTPWYANTNYTRYSATAQSGSGTTIQLASGASSINGFYQGLWVNILSGTGSGQKRQVISYSGTTKTCVVAAWGTNPDNTSVYEFAFADIYVAADLDNQRRIALPLQNGVIKQGLYTFNYTVFDQDTNDYYTASSSINIDFTFPTVNLTYNVDCVTPILESTDATDYTIQGATATVTRTHTVAAPPNVDNNVYTGNDITIIVPQFYAPTTYQATLSSSVVWDFGGGITISGLLTASQPIATLCDNWVCDMFCCINNLFNKWVSLEQTNSGQSAYYFKKWELGMLIIDMIKTAYQCGQNTVVNNLINQFYIETGCTANCNCSNNTAPTLVQGLGLANATQYSLAAADSYVQVTTSTGANSVAWTVGLSPAALNLLASNPTLTGLINITVANPSDGVYEITGATVTAGSGVGVSTTSSGGVIVDTLISLQNLLYSDFNDEATTGTTLEVLKSYTLPAGKLSVDGSRLKVKALFEFDVTTNASGKTVSVRVNSTDIFLAIPADQGAIAFISFEYELYREDATTLKVMVNSVKALNGGGTPLLSYNNIPSSNITVNNLSSSTNTINVTGNSIVAGDIINKDFSIEYLGK